MKKLPRHAYFPFGGGPRICIGNSFAMMEATLILATIAQRFQLKARSAPLPIPSVTLRPDRGYRVKIAERRFLPRGKPITNPLGRTHQVERVDERVGNRCDRLAAFSLETEILNLFRFGLEADALDVFLVEILVARAHSADVEREAHLERR